MQAAEQQGTDMLITLPGHALDILKESKFPDDHPDIWKRMVTRHTTTYNRRIGVEVHMELESFEWFMFRAVLAGEVIRITRVPYPARTKDQQNKLVCINKAVAAIDRVLK